MSVVGGESMTINWQHFNSVQIIREDICPWQVATTIDHNQQAILQLWKNCRGKSMSMAGGDDNR